MEQDKKDTPFQLPEVELIEVLDQHLRPIMFMPRPEVLQQKLLHNVVLVVIRNRQNKIYIHKRATGKSYSGMWTVSAAGYPQAGEALEDAALREVREELGITEISLKKVAESNPIFSGSQFRSNLFLSIPKECIIIPAPEEIAEGMFVDQDELEALLRDFPELIGPSLEWATSVCNLFA